MKFTLLLTLSLLFAITLLSGFDYAEAAKSSGNSIPRTGVELCGDRLCGEGEEMSPQEKLAYYLLSLIEFDDSTVIQQGRFSVGGVVQQASGFNSAMSEIPIGQFTTSSIMDRGVINSMAVSLEQSKLQVGIARPSIGQVLPSAPPQIDTVPLPEGVRTFDQSEIRRQVVALKEIEEITSLTSVKFGTLDPKRFGKIIDNTKVLTGTIDSSVFRPIPINPDSSATANSQDSTSFSSRLAGATVDSSVAGAKIAIIGGAAAPFVAAIPAATGIIGSLGGGTLVTLAGGATGLIIAGAGGVAGAQLTTFGDPVGGSLIAGGGLVGGSTLAGLGVAGGGAIAGAGTLASLGTIPATAGAIGGALPLIVGTGAGIVFFDSLGIDVWPWNNEDSTPCEAWYITKSSTSQPYTWRDAATYDLCPSQLRFGDFNGDDLTDVFKWDYINSNYPPIECSSRHDCQMKKLRQQASTPTSYNVKWKYSSGGTSSWTTIESSIEVPQSSASSARFGYFDNDKKTDILMVWPGESWKYYSSVSSEWISLPHGNGLSSLRFVDIDGDGITDVFTSSNGQWKYSSGGVSDWINLRTSTVPIESLSFGYFNNDRNIDVFTQFEGRYLVSFNGEYDWFEINSQTTPFAKLRYGDFDGDRFTDIFYKSNTEAGQWQYLSGGLGEWIPIGSSSRDLLDLRFGDFDGDGKTDVFTYGSDEFND